MANEPYWLDGILFVYSKKYMRYIANYAPSHYLLMAMTMGGSDNE